MRDVFRRLFAVLLASSLLLGLVVSGCGETNSTTDSSKAPEIPPQTTFVISFDDITSQAGAASVSTDNSGPKVQLASLQTFITSKTSDSATVSPTATIGQYTNFAYAVTSAGVWSIAVAANIALPAASFVESFNHEAVKQADGSWQWSYNVVFLGVTYTARLVGKRVSNDIEWNMYISKENTFTDFNWYSGKCDAAVTAGTWTLRKGGATVPDPTEFIDIDWHRNLTANTWDIKYTCVEQANQLYGGYIKHGWTNDPSYNAFFTISNADGSDMTQIEWNRTTKAGRVQSQKHFSDSNWHYWDSSYINTTGS